MPQQTAQSHNSSGPIKIDGYYAIPEEDFKSILANILYLSYRYDECSKLTQDIIAKKIRTLAEELIASLGYYWDKEMCMVLNVEKQKHNKENKQA